MTNPSQPNADLAQNYYTAVTPATPSDLPPSAITHYERIMGLIAGLDVDITAFYREHGSLRGLDIEGLPKAAKQTLELILEKGLEAAVSATIDRKTRRLEAEIDTINFVNESISRH